MTADEQIRSTIGSFAKAYRARDLKTLADTYSDALIKDRAGSPPERKPETVERIRQVFAQYDTDIQVEIDELVVSGDLAYARGSFEVTLTSRSGQETKIIKRRYIEIWRSEEGVWRVSRTMDNALE